MNFKTTLALVALAALVAAYFWFFEREATPTYEVERQARYAAQQEGDRLLPPDLEAADITAITIDRGDQQARIEKQDGAWLQVAPVRFPLNDYRPQQVVDQAVSLRFVSRFQPGVNDQPTAGDLGLESPRATITLQTGDASHVIRLGKPSSGGRAYAMVEGDPNAYVVDDALHDAVLTGRISDWRKRSFEAPQVGQLQRVTLARDGQTHSVRKIDGRWFLDEGGSERVDAAKLEALVKDASGFYISEFVSDDPQKLGYYGLDDPRVTVSLIPTAASEDGAGPADAEGAEGEGTGAGEGEDEAPGASAGSAPTLTLRVGAPSDLKGESFYATWSGGDEPSHVVFSINKSVVEKLTQPIDNLRDPRITLAEGDKVRELRIARGEDEVIQLEKTPEKWTFGDPKPAFDLDQEAAEALVRAFTEARATGYTQEPPSEPVAAKVAIHVTGGTGAERLVIHGPRQSGDGASYIVLREGEHVGYLVPQEQLAPAFEPVLALRDKTILNVPEEEIAALTLQQPDGVALTFRRPTTEGGGEAPATQPAAQTGWALEGAASFEGEALRALLNALRGVRVESWATNRAAFTPDATLTLAMRDGSAKTLRVETGSRRGQLDGVEPLFTLPQGFVDRLMVEYRDRLVLPLAMDQIASVTFDDGEKRVTLSRNDQGNYIDADGARVDQSAGAGAFDTLANLRVERYLPASAETAIGEDARVTITVTRQEGEPSVLVLDESNDVATLEGRGGAFRLGEERRKKLLAPLTAPPPSAGGAGDDVFMSK